MSFCEHYVFDKQIRVKFSKRVMHMTRGELDYIHSDLWGPYRVFSKTGAKYFMILIDNYFQKVCVYFMKFKEKIFLVFVIWETMIEKQTERKIKCVRTDNGFDFCNHPFNYFCSTKSIIRHRTCIRTTQQNA